MLFRLYTHWRNSFAGIPATVWFLALVSLVNRCGGMVVAFLTIYLTQHLGYDIRHAGYVLGFFGAGALAGAYIGGRLTDRIGYFPIQFWSLILNGLMLLVLMLVEQFWFMCAAVFVLSVVTEVFRPANSVAVALHSARETRTRSISLMRMAYNLGWTVAPALGGLLAALGWHWLFWIDGLTCLGAAFMLRWLVPPKKPATDEEAVAEAEKPKGSSPYRDKDFVVFILLTMLNAIIFMQLIWTVPIFFKEVYHWNEATIGLVSAVNGLCVFMVEMPLIFRIEGRRSGLYYVRVGLVLYALSYSFFHIDGIGGLIPALLFMVVISFGEIFVMPFSFNFAYGRATHGNQGQYMALYTMAYSIANILAPLIGTQVIAAWGFHSLWWLLALMSVIAWISVKVLEKRMINT